MTVPMKASLVLESEWHWPINCDGYDCSTALTDAERQEIAFLAARIGGPGNTGGQGGIWPARSYQVLRRLLQPLDDICLTIQESYADVTNQHRRATTIRAFVLEMNRRGSSFWAWDESIWVEFIASTLEQFNTRLGWSWKRHSKPGSGTRMRVLLAAYLLEKLPDIRVCGDDLPYTKLARLVFGEQRVQAAIDRIVTPLSRIGYSSHKEHKITRAICIVLLLNRSPLLEDITEEHIRWVHATTPRDQYEIATFSRVLVTLGILNTGIAKSTTGPIPVLSSADGTLSPEWEEWCQQWRTSSTLEPITRDSYYTTLLMIGRWLKQEHPLITSPTQWTATLATECVAAVTHMTVGQYISDFYRAGKRWEVEQNFGKPLKPRTISGYLTAVRAFFRDLQESERIPLVFNPDRYLSLPRSVRNKIGPDPRVIDRALWAKLVWSGQHLESEDLPSKIYPLEMVRAVAAVWLFTALRSDEVCRLQLGCIEWPATDIIDPETGKRVTREQVCYLHIPANKTAPAFKKPVAPYVGKMIDAWEKVRPPQKPELDRKSAEKVSYLFSLRGQRLGHAYINMVLIPMLSAKANVPPLDHRGRVTSHRARATIATFLGNCENPMSLWQLMRWLGHRTEETTRHYVDADITKVAVKVAEGSFLQQNLASIPVLIDNDAVVSGAASQGQPWKFFDLGHGYCTLPEWAACRHRMACAKCDFYQPKSSTKMQILEANGNLTRMLEFIALGEEERKLVEQGISLNQALLNRLADEPTPAGPTPRELHLNKRKVLPVLTETVGLVEPESIPHHEDGEEQEQGVCLDMSRQERGGR
ncbi:MAG: site-specific integrase [Ktedonobacteraceae bacterium]|nr:site-specific integrase [Ktedonobacteraceae bacterium]